MSRSCEYATSGSARTRGVEDWGGLPGTMMEQAWCRLALVVGCLALLVCPVEAADKSVDSGSKHRTDMHNRLQLRAEQEAYRQSVEPLSPADRQNLELKLQQQRLQQRNLQLRQDQRLQAERHKRHINGSLDPYRINRPGPGFQQQQQQQRLQMRMQRNTWP
ncbi:MAG: hypothetical protein WBO16_06880 [Gammaproteobacteria bacterium]